MEFEGFNFDAEQFISLPGLNENKEVLAVLRYSPNSVVGANKPFLVKQKKQMKNQQKQKAKQQLYGLNLFEPEQQQQITSDYDYLYVTDEQDQDEAQKNQIVFLAKSIDNKHWHFIGGDLYVNLDLFTSSGLRKRENYSHWNQWRPYANCQAYQNSLQLNMRTDNQAPYEFQYLINYLQRMQNKEAFQISKMLEQYNLYVKGELNNCNKIKSFCEGHFEDLQQCLADNYTKSLEKANEIISSIGQQYPFLYFIRKHNSSSLRMQVSSIGFNYNFTEILCENRYRYLQSLKRNGFKEVFTNYTHYQLLNMNLLQQSEAEIEIVTVDDIVIPCKIQAIQHDLTTFNLTKDISFTNYLRIYKFEIDEYQLKRVQQIRKERPLTFEEQNEDFEYNFQSDQFIQQYYHYFQHQRNKSANTDFFSSIVNLEINKESDKQNQSNFQSESVSLKMNSQEDSPPDQSIFQKQKELPISHLNQAQNSNDFQQQILLSDLLKQQQQLNQSSLLQSVLTKDQQKQEIIPSLINNQQIIVQQNPLLLNGTNLNILQQEAYILSSQQQQQKQLLQLQNIQFNNNLQNQYLYNNPSIISPQQIQIIPQQQIVQNQLQNQIGLITKIEQDAALQIILQEIQQLQELKQSIANEITIKTPLYLQLKQLLINSSLNQQICYLDSMQLQFIKNYEESTQLLNLIQLQIDQKSILICS